MDDRSLRRAAFRSDLTKLRCGAFVETAVWDALGEDDRVRLEVAASHESIQGRFIASHASAAALREVPRIRDDARGLVGFVDLYWPDFALIGEFAGLVKYRDPAIMQGQDASEVVVTEKIREDRLRALGNRCTRWIRATLRRADGAAAASRAPTRGGRA